MAERERGRICGSDSVPPCVTYTEGNSIVDKQTYFWSGTPVQKYEDFHDGITPLEELADILENLHAITRWHHQCVIIRTHSVAPEIKYVLQFNMTTNSSSVVATDIYRHAKDSGNEIVHVSHYE